MRQRLGLAFALLGDPGALVLDEPINGLDPEGIRWIREFLRQLAGEGRTVLVSSHLLSEVQQTVDQVVIISRGRLVHTGTLAGLEAESRVARRRARIARRSPGHSRPPTIETRSDGLARRRASPPPRREPALTRRASPLSLLAPEREGLENVFLELVGDADGQEGAR